MPQYNSKKKKHHKKHNTHNNNNNNNTNQHQQQEEESQLPTADDNNNNNTINCSSSMSMSSTNSSTPSIGGASTSSSERSSGIGSDRGDSHQTHIHQLIDENSFNKTFTDTLKLRSDKKSYEVKHSDVMGRYLTTSRALKAGEIVLRELPLVVGPCADTEPLCLGCYVIITGQRTKQYKCPGCGWPMCGAKCPGAKTERGHSTWECSMLREKRVADYLDRSKGKELINMYEVITPLRCLLLKTFQPDKWELLNKMESHNVIRKNIPSLWNRNQQVIVDRLRNTWGFKEFTELEIHTVCGYLEVNCFEIGQNGSRARALYNEAFLLAHDCSPNTVHTDDPFTYELIIRVLSDVPKNEAITLSYAYTLQGTLKRREHLQEGKFFWCQCQRCSDPTELGTNSSALICPKCKNLVLSAEPLNQNALWKCQSCAYKVTGEAMLVLVDKIFHELDSISVNDVKSYEEFLIKYRNVLYRNHYLCISAKHSLCQLYGRSDEYLIQKLTIEQLQTKERYCRDVLGVIDHLERGLSRLRGVMMYELHAPIMIQATRLFEAKKIDCDNFKKRLREVVSLLKQVVVILALEPQGSQEYEMAEAARDALKRIGKL